MDVDEYDRKCLAMILEHGWMIQFVGAGDDEPQFAYTVGLTVAGLPELIVSGLDSDLMGTLLNDAAKRAMVEEFKAGAVLEGIASVGFRVIAATRAPVGLAGRFYGPEKVTVLQLVWPDKNGSFPGDPGWSLDGFQKLYGEVV